MAKDMGQINFYYCDSEVTDGQCTNECVNNTSWADEGQIYYCSPALDEYDCYCICQNWPR